MEKNYIEKHCDYSVEYINHIIDATEKMNPDDVWPFIGSTIQSFILCIFHSLIGEDSEDFTETELRYSKDLAQELLERLTREYNEAKASSGKDNKCN